MKELKITFKNVHQGDAIFLNWLNDNNNLEIGVIDCSLCKFTTNPILEELKSYNSLKEIKFFILTHPHTDHYSGLVEIFNYLYDNQIRIHYFIHSCNFSLKQLNHLFGKQLSNDDFFDFLAKPVFLKGDKDQLKHIFKSLMMHERGQIRPKKKLNNRIINKVVNVSSEIWPFSIAPNLSIEFKSPVYSEEIKRYLNSMVDDDPEKHISLGLDNNPNANYLSIITQINFYNHKILFTSDAKKVSFNRLKDSSNEYKKFKLCQLPHHGSKYNFNDKFWNDFLKHSQDCKFIISAGDKYNHPDKGVVEKVKENAEIHCTNEVNGFKEALNNSNENHLINSLDSFLPMNINPNFGDKEFTIDSSGNIKCNTINN